MKYVLILVALALAACDPYLYQHSTAPPGRSARLDGVDGFWGLKHYRLEISEGVALALTCNDGGPCEKPNLVSDDPSIAEVRPASLVALERMGYGGDATPSSAFVVVGKAPGTTKLHLKTRKGKRDVVVTVVAPPAPPNAQTAATGTK
ncbi:MAG TPA: hypothetical protein VIV11_33680 [Kofleriaceae bacterium]